LYQNEIARIVIPDYIRYVKLSNSRVKKYYEENKKKVPERFLNEKYGYVKHKRGSRLVSLLTDLQTREPVIANPRSHGTPKIAIINGQGIYDQSIQKQQRDVMMKAIKNSFKEYVNQLPEINVPVRIYAELHDVILNPNGRTWDLDNRFYMYQKAFQDCLTGNHQNGIAQNKIILRDDSNIYVTQAPSPLFVPIEEHEERKIVFIFCEEKDPRIINNEKFNQLREKNVSYK
jgi:hypothetical protein